VPPKAEGRWSIVDSRPGTTGRVPRGGTASVSPTEVSAASAQQLLTRHGIVTRETVASEAMPGGFSAVYQVLKAMEDAGRIRRGYFVAGLGAAQFAMPAALDLLRSMRDVPETPRTVVLAATDPANPYGAIVKWPETPFTITRSVGARVFLVNGALAGYLRRGERELLLFLPEAEPQRSQFAREVARMLLHLAVAREESRRGMLLAEINGEPAVAHAASRIFIDEGFTATAMGLQARLRPGGSLGPGARGLRPAHSGIELAAPQLGGRSMAEPRRTDDELVDNPTADETRESEQERIRSSNDHDQAMERAGGSSQHNRGCDEAVRGNAESVEDVDPDSAESDIDRDDTNIE
jgi:ATP-dependent Lhr-like helicase